MAGNNLVLNLDFIGTTPNEFEDCAFRAFLLTCQFGFRVSLKCVIPPAAGRHYIINPDDNRSEVRDLARNWYVSVTKIR